MVVFLFVYSDVVCIFVSSLYLLVSYISWVFSPAVFPGWFGLVWLHLSCDHGWTIRLLDYWIRSGSVNVG